MSGELKTRVPAKVGELSENLIQAIKNGEEDTVFSLLERTSISQTAKDNAMRLASENGHATIVCLFLREGARDLTGASLLSPALQVGMAHFRKHFRKNVTHSLTFISRGKCKIGTCD